ncbi:MAG: hypothetical protein EOO38_01580 [Cytophagaceae bacterium]|nr:MAG: hypothetical protein EOO38_01580 [Cytophagaceae bacterium]
MVRTQDKSSLTLAMEWAFGPNNTGLRQRGRNAAGEVKYQELGGKTDPQRMVELARTTTRQRDRNAALCWKKAVKACEPDREEFRRLLEQPGFAGTTAIEEILHFRDWKSLEEVFFFMPQGLYANGKVRRTSSGLFTLNSTGLIDGPAFYILRHGLRYMGDFKEGKACGDGRVTHWSGDYYDGAWAQGRPSCPGVYRSSNGAPRPEAGKSFVNDLIIEAPKAQAL